MLVFIICVSTYRLSTHKNIVNCAPDRTRTYTPCGHDILSVTRLPISPQAQACPSLRTATTFTTNGRNAVKHTGSVKVERRVGFEPTNSGFADRSIRPLWHLLIQKGVLFRLKFLHASTLIIALRCFMLALLGITPTT